MDHLSLLATQLQLVGSVLDQVGRPEEARRRFEADLAIASRLAAHDPANHSWGLEKATSLRTLAQYEIRSGNLDQARSQLLEVQAIEKKTLDEENDDSITWEHRALTGISLALLARAEGRPTDARAILGPLIDQLEAQDVADFPGDLPTLYADILVLDAELAEAAGKGAPAQASLERANRILSPRVPESRDPALLRPWIRLQILQGNTQAARESAAVLADMGFARADYLAFCHRHGLPAAV